MPAKDIHAVLYDLSSAMGGESRIDPLITKVLQRLMAHTGHPVAAYLALKHGAGNDREERYRVTNIIGEDAVSGDIGVEVRLPVDLEDISGLSARLPRSLAYPHSAWIPVPGEGMLLLCSATPVDSTMPPVQTLGPAMRDFAKALKHCRDSESHVAGLENRYRDTTKSLRSERKRFLNLLISMPDAIILADSHGIMQTINPHTEALFGYASDELIGNPVEMLVPQFNHQIRATYAEAMTQPASPTSMGIGRRLTVRRKNGEFFPVSISISPVIIEGMEEIIISIRDMAEYENLANQFQQAQKMEALGALVGGVSHDFNTLLTTILANAHIAKKQVSNPTAGKKLEEIEQQCMAAQEMIAQLLAFSRKERVQTKRLSLTALIKGSLSLYTTAIPRSIHLDVELAEEDLNIAGNSTQIQQVILNLLNNARDALADAPEKRIRINLKGIAIDPLMRGKNPMFTATRYAQLTLSDTGHGIPHNVVKKIFEPFFTTKPVGHGTGLGLSMVYSTIEAHHGIIEVDSQEGRGTSFRIFLPLA